MIRAEIYEIANRKIEWNQNLVFEKINKTDEILDRLTKRKAQITKIRNVNGGIITSLIEIRIIRESMNNCISTN